MKTMGVAATASFVICALACFVPSALCSSRLSIAQIAEKYSLTLDGNLNQNTGNMTLCDLPGYGSSVLFGFVGASASVCDPPTVPRSIVAHNLKVLSQTHCNGDLLAAIDASSHFIDTWYFVKTVAGRFCPFKDEEEGKNERKYRRLKMKKAMEELKSRYLSRFQTLAANNYTYKHAIEEHEQTVKRLEDALADLDKRGFLSRFRRDYRKIERELVSALELVERCINCRLQNLNDLAMTVKLFRKLAAIYGEDWEEELKQTVDESFLPQYDLGAYDWELTGRAHGIDGTNGLDGTDGAPDFTDIAEATNRDSLDSSTSTASFQEYLQTMIKR